MSYHYIYRQDRLQQRALLGRKCQPPSVEQLERIATELNNNFNSTFSGENVLSQLQLHKDS